MNILLRRGIVNWDQVSTVEAEKDCLQFHSLDRAFYIDFYPEHMMEVLRLLKKALRDNTHVLDLSDYQAPLTEKEKP